MEHFIIFLVCFTSELYRLSKIEDVTNLVQAEKKEIGFAKLRQGGFEPETP